MNKGKANKTKERNWKEFFLIKGLANKTKQSVLGFDWIKDWLKKLKGKHKHIFYNTRNSNNTSTSCFKQPSLSTTTQDTSTSSINTPLRSK